MTTEVIGYARVSTEDQNLDLQRDALGRARCGPIYEDRASEARADQPGLALALEVARAGDQLARSGGSRSLIPFDRDHSIQAIPITQSV